MHRSEFSLKSIYTSLFNVDLNEKWGNGQDIRFRHIAKCLQENDSKEPYDIWKNLDFGKPETLDSFQENLSGHFPVNQTFGEKSDTVFSLKSRAFSSLSLDFDADYNFSVEQYPESSNESTEAEKKQKDIVYGGAFAMMEENEEMENYPGDKYWRNNTPVFTPKKHVKVELISSLQFECPETEYPYVSVKRRMIEHTNLRRKTILNSLLADWEIEVNTYDLLISYAEDHHNTIKAKKSHLDSIRKSSVMRKEKTLDQKIKALFTIILSKSFGCSLGVFRLSEHSDEITYAWSKAKDDLFDTKPKTEHRAARDIKEVTFWLTSRHYQPPAELTGYAKMQDYVKIHPVKSSFLLRKSEFELMNVDSQTSVSSSSKTISSPPRSFHTNLTPSFNSSDMDTSSSNLLKSFDPSTPFPVKMSKSTKKQTNYKNDNDKKQVEKLSKNSDDTLTLTWNDPLDTNQDTKKRKSGQKPRNSLRMSLVKSPQDWLLTSRSFGNQLPEEVHQKIKHHKTPTLIFRNPNKESFQRSLEKQRNKFSVPFEVEQLRRKIKFENMDHVQPTDELLTSVILQMPHCYVAESEDEIDLDEAPAFLLNGNAKSIMKLSLKRTPAVKRVLMRKTKTVIQPKDEILPRIAGINDEMFSSFDTSIVKKCVYKIVRPQRGSRKGSDKYLLQCVLPDVQARAQMTHKISGKAPKKLSSSHGAFNNQNSKISWLVEGRRGTFVKTFSSSNESSSSQKDLTDIDEETNLGQCVWLPPESVEANDILEFANNAMAQQSPHLIGLFGSILANIEIELNWQEETNATALSMGLCHLAKELLDNRQTPGHPVRFKLNSIIAASTVNPVLRQQLCLIAKQPGSWLDQTLRCLHSYYPSCRFEACMTIAHIATHHKLMKSLGKVNGVHSLIFDIVSSLLKASEIFVENFAEFFVTATYLFHFSQDPALLDAVLDRCPRTQSVKLVSVWPLFVIYVYRYWSPKGITRLSITDRQLMEILTVAVRHPLSRYHARRAIEVVETHNHLHSQAITRWPLESGNNADMRVLYAEQFENIRRKSITMHK